MINKEVVDYIKRMSDKGFSLKKIRGELKGSGHSEEDIEDCIAVVTKEKPAAVEKKVITEEKEFEPIIEERRFSPKKILVIILCLVVIGSAPFGLKLYKEYFRGKEEIPQIEEKPRMSPPESPKELELDYEIIYQEEFEKCMDDPIFHQCVAQVSGDLNLCEKWVEINNDVDDRDWCVDGYVLFKVTLEGSGSCDKVKHEEVGLLCNAIKSQERSYCDMIENNDVVKGVCISMVTNKQSCGELTSEDNEVCQEIFKFYSALKQNKIEMCELLGFNTNKITCKALLSNNPEICKNIKPCEDEARLKAQRRIEEQER